MAQGIRTAAELNDLVRDYSQFGEFVLDVETRGPNRGNPYRNDVFWVSLAGPGRADVIPCGHPIGERVYYDLDDEAHRINPANNHYQEHRINESSGRLKWFDIPPQFTKAPKQIWISDVADALSPLMFSDRRKIGHNVKFDIRSWAKYYDDVMPPGPYGDTIVAAKLVNENYHGYRLGDCVKRHFGFQYEKIGKAGPENFPYSEARLYSYLDAKYDWLLWEYLKPRLIKQKVQHIFDLEMLLLPAVIDMEQAGIAIDEKALAALSREFKTEMARHKIAINDAAGYDINLNANKQLAELVYETLGHRCREFTPSGQRSTAAATLEVFSKDPIIGHIQEHAKLGKLQSTFIESITRNTFEGRVHASFNQVGTVSGRFSCSDPNIQQVPSRTERGKRIREVFIAGPKNVLVVADLSQIELRVLAHFTQDPVLLSAYRNGMDLHSILAERVFGPDFNAFQRSLAKNGNFSVLFGAFAKTLVRKYGFPTEKLAQEVLDGFYDTYKKVQPWKDDVIETAFRAKPCHVKTILGRKRRLPGLGSLDRKVRSAAQRQAISVTVSGSAADLFKLAMIECHEQLRAAPYPAHILMTIHDELVVEVPEKDAEDGLFIVKTAMEEITNPFTGEPILTVPIVADAKLVTSWAEGK